jgi:hypothetical protein
LIVQHFTCLQMIVFQLIKLFKSSANTLYFLWPKGHKCLYLKQFKNADFYISFSMPFLKVRGRDHKGDTVKSYE